mmetsp:Transcript_43980/g.140969  ORF Transcript_43980/g.140969 Transcript_43980/m.140969 type:complete len:203 (-) Transcript_43980:3576-4184(-)
MKTMSAMTSMGPIAHCITTIIKNMRPAITAMVASTTYKDRQKSLVNATMPTKASTRTMSKVEIVLKISWLCASARTHRLAVCQAPRARDCDSKFHVLRYSSQFAFCSIAELVDPYLLTSIVAIMYDAFTSLPRIHKKSLLVVLPVRPTCAKLPTSASKSSGEGNGKRSPDLMTWSRKSWIQHNMSETRSFSGKPVQNESIFL